MTHTNADISDVVIERQRAEITELKEQNKVLSGFLNVISKAVSGYITTLEKSNERS